jgi:protein-serine/threonine kinase
MLPPAQQIGRTSPQPSLPNISNLNINQPGSIQPSINSNSNFNSHSNSQNQLLPTSSSPSSEKGPDYVYFERKPAGFGEGTQGKAMAAKMKLELYYKEAVEGVVGRKER